MKAWKKIFGIVICIFPLLIIVYFILGILNVNAPRMCTIQTFGDGTYNILIRYDSENTEQYYLKNSITNEVISNNVLKYKVNNKESLVYVIGKKDINDIGDEYIILSYKTGQYGRYSNLEEMTEKNKLIFRRDQKFEIPS